MTYTGCRHISQLQKDGNFVCLDCDEIVSPIGELPDCGTPREGLWISIEDFAEISQVTTEEWKEKFLEMYHNKEQFEK